MRKQLLKLGTLCIALSCAVGPLRAQLVRGTVLLPDSSRAAGIVVTATDSHGDVSARALTSERGDFVLRMSSPGRYEIRALRIGFSPTVVPAVDVGTADVQMPPIVLRGEAVSLARVTVRGESVCKVQRDSAKMVARLWVEARTAITATQLSASGGRVSVRGLVRDQQSDATGTQLITQHNTYFSGSSLRPFASIPPDSLAKVGYRAEDVTGVTYRAPDADVLLSDSFASQHCFRVEPPTPDRGDWVGVSFRPARERDGVVDIAGTLWLDRSTAELRVLEFTYTNLPEEVRDANAGGNVEFLRLSNGTWLINKWVIRMPRTSMKAVTSNQTVGSSALSPEVRSQTTYRTQLDGLQFTGGEVTSVTKDGVPLFSAGESARDYSPALIADDAKLAVSCRGDSTRSDLPAVLRGSVWGAERKPIGGANVRITWRGEYRSTGQYTFSYTNEQRDVVSSAEGDWFLCGVPRERVLTVRATFSGKSSPALTVRIPKDRASAGVDLQIQP